MSSNKTIGSDLISSITLLRATETPALHSDVTCTVNVLSVKLLAQSQI